jgi:hypothetical protein
MRAVKIFTLVLTFLAVCMLGGSVIKRGPARDPATYSDGNGSRIELDENTTNPTTTSGKISLFFSKLSSESRPILKMDDQETTATGRSAVGLSVYMENHSDAVIATGTSPFNGLSCLDLLDQTATGLMQDSCNGNLDRIKMHVPSGGAFVPRTATLWVSGDQSADTGYECTLNFVEHDDPTDSLQCTGAAGGEHGCTDTGADVIAMFHLGGDDCETYCDPIDTNGEYGDFIFPSVEVLGSWNIGLSARYYCGTSATNAGDPCSDDADCDGDTCDKGSNACTKADFSLLLNGLWYE